MKDLNEIRLKINEIDGKMRKLFSERMAAAKEVAETMVKAGVRGLWNFANMELKIDDESVVVENIHLGDSLMTLCYEIKERAEGEE